MALDELKQLPDLVWLGLPVHVLQVQQLRHGGVDEDVVASADPGESEPERLGEGGMPRQIRSVSGSVSGPGHSFAASSAIVRPRL